MNDPIPNPQSRYPADPTPIMPAQRPATLGEIWGASRSLQGDDNSDAATRRMERAYDPVIAAINDVRRKEGKPELLNPATGMRALDAYPDAAAVNPGGAYGAARQSNVGQQAVQADVDREIARIKRQYRGALNGVPDSADKIMGGAIEADKARRAQAQEVMSRAEGLPATLTSLAGGMSKGLEDPLVISTLPFGAGEGSLLAVMAKEALIQGGLSALMQPGVAQNRATLGEELTLGEAATNVATAGALGAIVTGGLHVAAPVIGRGYDAGIAMIHDALPDALKLRWQSAAHIPGVELPQAVAGAVGTDRFTPEMRAGANVIERAGQLTEASPYAPGAANLRLHDEKLMTAAEMLANPQARAAYEPSSRAAMRGGTALASGSVPAPARIATPDGNIAAYMRAVRGAESGGNDLAAARTSNAFGRYQFVRGTWLNYYIRRYGRQGLDDAAILAKRADGAIQDQLMIDLTADNARTLQRNGLPATPENLYMVHFLGPGDAPKVLHAPDDVPVASLIRGESVAANRWVEHMTAGELRARIARKVGGGEPVHIGGEGAAAVDDGSGAALDSEEQRLLDAQARAVSGDEATTMAPGADGAPPVPRETFSDVPREQPFEQGADIAQFVPRLEIDPASPAPLTEAVIKAGGLDIDRGFNGQVSDVQALNERRDVIQRLIGLEAKTDTIGDQVVKVLHGEPSRVLPYGLVDAVRGASIDALAERAADAGIIEGATPELRRAAFLDRLAHELDGQTLRESALGAAPDLFNAAPVAKLERLRRVAEAVDQRAFKRWDADDPVWDEINRHEAEAAIEAARQDVDVSGGEAKAIAFDDPTSAEAQAAIQSMMHDLRMLAEAEPGRAFRTDAEGGERGLQEILDDLDADDTAIAAVKGCL